VITIVLSSVKIRTDPDKHELHAWRQESPREVTVETRHRKQEGDEVPTARGTNVWKVRYVLISMR
jgi:hypothetical protein